MLKPVLMYSVIMFLAMSSYGQDYRQFELGIQTTTCIGCSVARWGLGPHVTFNINKYVALDGIASFSTTSLKDSTEDSGGRSTQLLAGPKLSIRGSRFSLFAMGRPGFVRWSHVITGVQSPGNPDFPNFSFGGRNLFAVNFAGGLQYALNSRVDVQIELGNTVVRQVNRTGISQFTNNVQTTSGIAYKLGPPSAVHRDTALAQHKFFDRPNLLLLSAGLLAQSADAVTTQRHLANCRKTNVIPGSDIGCEADPLFRPFVTHGWGGQIAISTIVSSAEVLLMYGIHRMGYHTIERTVPVAEAIANSTAAYRNLQY